MSVVQTSAGLGLLLVVNLLVGPVVAWAQGGGPLPEERVAARPSEGARTFGQPQVSHTLQAYAFTGATAADNAVFDTNGFGSRFCNGGVALCRFVTSVQLPAGARVTDVELAGCDTSSSGAVMVELVRVPNPESSINTLVVVNTGSTETPGCAFISESVTPAHTIDNFHNSYFVRVSIFGGAGSATRFQAVRVFYNLQVSPAPATPTFNDVPVSHPFFQFIEALAAAGITGGCGASPPLYCPDNPLTRGQMAVFLSRALGLQFAP